MTSPTRTSAAPMTTWCYVEGYPGVKSPRIKEWFKERTVVAGNFVAAYPEPTVKQVLKALAVNEVFQRVLDDPAAEEALQHPALAVLIGHVGLDRVTTRSD